MARTSEPDFQEGTLNPYVICAGEIQPGDRLGYKIIVVIDNHVDFWHAYMGPTGWSDDQIARMGDAVSEATATALFPTIAATGRKYSS